MILPRTATNLSCCAHGRSRTCVESCNCSPLRVSAHNECATCTVRCSTIRLFHRYSYAIQSRPFWHITFLCMVFTTFTLHAQEASADSNAVTLDLNSSDIQSPLPFQEPFNLIGTAPSGVTKVTVMWWNNERADENKKCCNINADHDRAKIKDCKINANNRDVKSTSWKAEEDELRLTIKELCRGKYYCFLFRSYRKIDEEIRVALKDTILRYLDHKTRADVEQEIARHDLERSRSSSAIAEKVSQTIISGLVSEGIHIKRICGRDSNKDGYSESKCLELDYQTRWLELSDTVTKFRQRHSDLQAKIKLSRKQLNKSFTELVENLKYNERKIAELGLPITHDISQSLMGLIISDSTMITRISTGIDSFVDVPMHARVPLQSQLDMPWVSERSAKIERNLEASQLGIQRLIYLGSISNDFRNLTGPSIGTARNDLLWSDLKDTLSNTNLALNLQRSLTYQSSNRERFLQDLAAKLVDGSRLVTTKVQSSNTRGFNHISADMGVLYVPNNGQVLPYVGANFYLIPVNRRVTLGERRGFLRRFSFTTGLTAAAMSQGSDHKVERQGIVERHALLFGAGFRVVKTLRLGLGGLLYREVSSVLDGTGKNSDRYVRTPVDMYVSVSYDWNVTGVFAKLGSLVGIL